MITYKGKEFSDDCTEFVKSLFLHSRFLARRNWIIFELNHLVNHQNTKLKTKNQALNRKILGFFWSSLQYHPLWVTLYYWIPKVPLNLCDNIF